MGIRHFWGEKATPASKCKEEEEERTDISRSSSFPWAKHKLMYHMLDREDAWIPYWQFRSAFFQKMYSHFTRGFTIRKSNFRLRKMYFHDSHFPLLKSQSCESAEGPAVAGCCCWAAMHSNHSKTVKWDSHFTLHFFQMWTVNRTWTVNIFFGKMRSSPTKRMGLVAKLRQAHNISLPQRLHAWPICLYFMRIRRQPD